MSQARWTDAQIENFLVEDTRSLPLVEGGLIPVTTYRVTWMDYDTVLSYGVLSAAEIATLTCFVAKRRKQPLGEALHDVLIPLREDAERRRDEQRAASAVRHALKTTLRDSFTDAVTRPATNGEQH